MVEGTNSHLVELYPVLSHVIANEIITKLEGLMGEANVISSDYQMPILTLRLSVHGDFKIFNMQECVRLINDYKLNCKSKSHNIQPPINVIPQSQPIIMPPQPIPQMESLHISSSQLSEGIPIHQVRTLFVKNLPEPDELDMDDLESLFEKFGKCSFQLKHKKRNLLVEYEDPKDATYARNILNLTDYEDDVLFIFYYFPGKDKKVNSIYITGYDHNIDDQILFKDIMNIDYIRKLDRFDTGYTVANFETKEAVESALQMYNNKQIRGKTLIAKRIDLNAEIYISSLHAETSEAEMYKLFKEFGNVISVFNSNTNFGFVNYTTSQEATEALQKGNGAMLHGKKILLKKGATGITVYIGNLDYNVTSDELLQTFKNFGVKIIDHDIKKGFAFLNVETQEDANLAILKGNGFSLKGREINVAMKKRKKNRNFREEQTEGNFRFREFAEREVEGYESRGRGGFRRNFRGDYRRGRFNEERGNFRRGPGRGRRYFRSRGEYGEPRGYGRMYRS